MGKPIDRSKWGSYQRAWEANERLGVAPGDLVWMCPEDDCEFAVTNETFFGGDESKLTHECPKCYGSCQPVLRTQSM